MKRSLILGQVSGLARDKAELGLDYNDLSIHVDIDQTQSDDKEDSTAGPDSSLRLDDDDENTSTPHHGAFKAARAASIHRQLISDMLGEWEEPETAIRQKVRCCIALE